MKASKAIETEKTIDLFEKLKQEEIERELNTAVIDKILETAYQKNKTSTFNRLKGHNEFLFCLFLNSLLTITSYFLITNDFLFLGTITIFVLMFFFLVMLAVIQEINKREIKNDILYEISKTMNFYISQQTSIKKKNIENLFLFLSIINNSSYQRYLETELLLFIDEYPTKRYKEYNYSRISTAYLKLIDTLKEHVFENGATQKEIDEKNSTLKQKREDIIKKTLFGIKKDL